MKTCTAHCMCLAGGESALLGDRSCYVSHFHSFLSHWAEINQLKQRESLVRYSYRDELLNQFSMSQPLHCRPPEYQDKHSRQRCVVCVSGIRVFRPSLPTQCRQIMFPPEFGPSHNTNLAGQNHQTDSSTSPLPFLVDRFLILGSENLVTLSLSFIHIFKKTYSEFSTPPILFLLVSMLSGDVDAAADSS